MPGIPGFSFRFRGKTARLLAIYQCFLEHPGVGLHPIQIAKYTGLTLAEATLRLDSTIELFVRLPKRKDGITRYRLTSSTATRSHEEVEKMIMAGAKRETISLYAFGLIVASVFTLAVILALPLRQLA